MRAERMARGATPLYEMTLAQARAADLADIRAAGGDPEPVFEVTDATFPGPAGELPVRLYRPSADRPLPTLVYFFGGGWTLGGIDTSDGVCRALANAAGCLVVTPGYRLAPEHPFPAATDDCLTALGWVAENADALGADPARVAVGGDSAGGNLAAVVALQARDRGLPLAAQLLVYPNTCYRADTESLRDNDDRWMFNHHSVDWYWRNYLPDPEAGRDPRVSPLLAPDLSGLPPALVITAEYDPLRDEGERYAERMRAAGVAVELTRYDGMAHGFFTMSGSLADARRALDQAARYLRETLWR
ncbi:alpha/beta hydrolase [Actinophytocola xanthii]|uniref:Alpha/beta hydrolase n=2 Tax=Actinophytocola xanthii TaxID=1912961 RepID=A0A1Q8CYA5_9PSEU|nr:alpha/beta hydrolase [Actinophytocola xanthii]